VGKLGNNNRGVKTCFWTKVLIERHIAMYGGLIEFLHKLWEWANITDTGGVINMFCKQK
jgi:hypothetical protein